MTAHLLKERLRKRMLCCRPGGSLVRPREEQSTTRCPSLQVHTAGQIDITQSPCNPNSNRRSRQSNEAEHGTDMVTALWKEKCGKSSRFSKSMLCDKDFEVHIHLCLSLDAVSVSIGCLIADFSFLGTFRKAMFCILIDYSSCSGLPF